MRILLVPQFRSVCRAATAGYDAKALYTSERETWRRAIAEELRRAVEPRGVTIEATPLRRLSPPPRLTSAIEEKLGTESA